MPEVHFIGTINNIYGLNNNIISLTWSIVPGNADWFLQKGLKNKKNLKFIIFNVFIVF